MTIDEEISTDCWNGVAQIGKHSPIENDPARVCFELPAHFLSGPWPYLQGRIRARLRGKSYLGLVSRPIVVVAGPLPPAMPEYFSQRLPQRE